MTMDHDLMTYQCSKTTKVMNWFSKVKAFIKKEWFLLIMLGMISLVILLFEIL